MVAAPFGPAMTPLVCLNTARMWFASTWASGNSGVDPVSGVREVGSTPRGSSQLVFRP